MTCIVGLVDGGRVVMGGDSAGVGGWDLRTRADEKVFVKGPLLLGFTTSFRMGQLLRYDLVVPEHPPDVDDFHYLVSHLVPAIRRCLKDGGYAARDKEVETGGQFLVGYRARLYHVHDDYQVAAYHEPYAACGCGADFAMGALGLSHQLNATGDTAGHFGHDPERLVRDALGVAERFSAGVRGPFVVRTLGPT